MTVAELITRLRELDPSGALRVVAQDFENVGADGTNVEEAREPEIAWVFRRERSLRDARTGQPFTYVEECWVQEGYAGAETVVRL